MSDARNMAQESPEARFLQELATGEPKVQCCQGCGRRFYYPRIQCPHCRSVDYQWVPMSRGGTVYSYSTLFGAQGSELYNVVLVDMDDGFRLMSTCPGASMDMGWIGARVQARADLDAQPPRLVFGKVA